MNTITDLLNLEDADIIISDVVTEGSVKTITLETRPKVNFCPLCGFLDLTSYFKEFEFWFDL